MQNRVFFPLTALDQWIVDGTVDLQGNELRIVAEGRRYKVVEAVRVLREVSGAGDSHELIGRVKARASLEQLGAEIVESSMLLGDAAYDVEPGWVGTPATTFAEHSASKGGAAAQKSDEELLAKFLSRGP